MRRGTFLSPPHPPLVDLLNLATSSTEKAPQALEAGTVPVYWGDQPLEAGVFNDRRILWYDGSEASAAFVNRTVHQLMTDKDARAAWFSEPVLQCGAEEWIAKWCEGAAKKIGEEWGKVAALRAEAEGR